MSPLKRKLMERRLRRWYESSQRAAHPHPLSPERDERPGYVLLISFTVAVLFSLLFVGRALAQDVHFAGLQRPAAELRWIGRANTAQSITVDRWWQTGTEHFTAASGWPIWLVNQRAMAAYCGGGADACHGINSAGVPTMVVALTSARCWWQTSVSHELVETLADPFINRIWGRRYVEIADPVENASASYNGVCLSDFASQAWFGTGPAWPPYSWLRSAFYPFDVRMGFDPLASYRTARVSTTSKLTRVIAEYR